MDRKRQRRNTATQLEASRIRVDGPKNDLHDAVGIAGSPGDEGSHATPPRTAAAPISCPAPGSGFHDLWRSVTPQDRYWNSED